MHPVPKFIYVIFKTRYKISHGAVLMMQINHDYHFKKYFLFSVSEKQYHN